MQAERWHDVKDILAEALSLDAAKRQAFIDAAPITDETRREIESLLEVEKKAQGFMSVPASGFTSEFFDSDLNENNHNHTRIGAFEIVGELGMGGMGAVYLGKRVDGNFEQQVAIKMLRREFNSDAIRRNFQREKTIQARLNHPNIARLLDAATTDDGVPYIVMEYIDGLSIDKFCDAKNLSLKDRLKLFNRVCEAVMFAHRNLIIHRDLKPSNIVVTKKGEPKLLDFGISKLLDDDLVEENTAVTLLGAMTPEYASPEQIKGETVSTATDIYSLGVVLYKLLTGSPPFKSNGKTASELLKLITEDEPTAPSAMVNGQSSVVGGQKKKHNPHSAIRIPQLKGDLDNIVLKALSKEPERRYQTADAFAADIWRFLDGLPVLARPATFGYWARKFFQRNKIAVIAGLLVSSSLIAGIVVSSWQARVARASAVAAVVESDNAKAEQKRSEKISKFMFKVIAYANPAWYAEGHRFGGDARVIDALEDLSDKIDVEFASELDVAAELHHRFNEVYLMVGRNEPHTQRKKYFDKKHVSHALRAYELRRQFYGDWHELVAKDMYYANYYLGKNDKERAEVLARAIEMMRSTNPNNLNLPYMLEGYAASLVLPDFQDLHDTYRQSAIPPTDENNYAVGERYLREAISLFRFHYKEDNYAILGNECVLAYALLMQDKWSDFDEHYSICKQGQTEMIRTEYADGKGKPTMLDLIEQKLAEKRGSSQR